MAEQFQTQTSGPATDGGAVALDRIKRYEEVLEICYWYEGEGLGDSFTPAAVTPFLPLP